MPKAAPSARNPEETRAALVAAARVEFEDAGYDATNSNKIAARAGYAPQTFYRHFADKLEIFRAVYEAWVGEEAVILDGVRGAQNAAAAVIRHHKKSLMFRRALRMLSLTDPAMRTARAESRHGQIERLRLRLPHLARAPNAELAAALLQIERLADACAEGEFADLGVSARQAEAQLAQLLAATLGKPR